MPLTSLYNAVKQNPVKTRTIQEIMQQNPEKKTMFVNSDIVVGKGYSLSSKSNSTSVVSIASELSPNQGGGLPVLVKTWQKCKCLKEKEGSFFCKNRFTLSECHFGRNCL